MVTTRKLVVIIIAILLGIVVLFAVLQRAVTDPAEAATQSHEQAKAAAKAAYQNGNYERAEQILYRAFGKRALKLRLEAPQIVLQKAGDPLAESQIRLVDDTPLYRPSTDPAFQKKGCSLAYVSGKIEQAVLGFDIMKASMQQRFCWEDGQITSLGDLDKWQHVTQYGEAINVDADGWRRGSSGYTDFGGKNKGGHYVNMTAKFSACAPIPTGCVLPKKYGIRLSIVEHKGGGVDTNVSRGDSD